MPKMLQLSRETRYPWKSTQRNKLHHCGFIRFSLISHYEEDMTEATKTEYKSTLVLTVEVKTNKHMFKQAVSSVTALWSPVYPNEN